MGPKVQSRPPCRTTRGQSDISAHSLRLHNIYQYLLSLPLLSPPPHCNCRLTDLLGRLVQDNGRSVANPSRCQKPQTLVTLIHRLSLLLIPSERRVSRFLFKRPASCLSPL